MKGTGKIPAIIAGIGMMLLIFDSKCALQGAKSGLELCLRSVIPSLFPFLVLSVMLIGALSGTVSSAVRLLADIIGIPRSAAPVLIPAFLGGYPVGAKCVADMYQNGTIRKQEAEHLLGFCSNAGPSFLFGIVSCFFSDGKTVIWLWLIHIMGAVCTAVIFPDNLPEGACSGDCNRIKTSQDLMTSSLKAMAAICGWIVFFRTFISFLDKWLLWRLPEWIQVSIIGMLELSNGCSELVRIHDVRFRFVICSCLLAFGGICVLLQTASVTRGLSLRNYITGKVIHTGFALFISSTVFIRNGLPCALMVCICLVAVMKIKNKGRNKALYPV